MSPHSREGLPWDPAETDQLAVLFFAAHARVAAWRPSHPGERAPPVGMGEIAAGMQRSVAAVFSQISRSGMANPGAKLRSCLPCAGAGRRKMFFSTHVGNRICYDCGRSELLRCA